ncbi:MAG: HAD hydrolase-like protein [Candidatus Omnitrophica bacterium]|nr:HAD hydrolase-like protein [Candidatus Omnitrophota bacterium]MDD5592548.1 HAD hydrolase-like protein [Candidatus Omnitrophota bacterium]
MTGNNRVKAIIFDLGNVVVDFDHRIAAKKISRFTPKTAQEIFDLFFDSKLTGLFEEGKISSREFFLKVKETLDLKLDYNGFLPIWNEIFFLSEKNQAVYALAKSLKKRYKVVLLSNINILHFDYLKKNFSVFDAFHTVITSYESGFRKPHPSIYQEALNVLKASAPEVFYTDDRSELIEGACRLGIRSFTFTGIEQLKKDLLDNGVNVT